MNGVIRRRGLAASKSIETIDIDRPDYWRIDFSTTTDNQTVVFGRDNNYALSDSETKAIILDGTPISKIGASSINVPEAGNHTVYIKITQPYAKGSYRFGIISSSLKPSYVRVPTNWTSNIGCDSSGNIPIVDLLTLKPELVFTAFGSFTIDTLRVSGEIDISNIPSSWKNKAKKIVKVHYNYI